MLRTMQATEEFSPIPEVSALVPRSLALAAQSVQTTQPKRFVDLLGDVGLDWRTSKQPLFLPDGRAMADAFGIVRDDCQRPLGTVGARYTIQQNVDTAEILDSYFAGLPVQLEKAGTFDGGKTVFMLARLPDALSLRLFRDQDEIRPYIAAVNGHVGNVTLSLFPTTVRIVCANTLRLALKRHSKDGFRIKHTRALADKRKEALTFLKSAGEQIKTHHEAMSHMASKQLSGAQIDLLIPQIVMPGSDMENASAQAKKIVATVRELVDAGEGSQIPGVRGTAYGLFQAVTEYSNHYRPARGSDKEKAERRLQRILDGDDMSDRAFEILSA